MTTPDEQIAQTEKQRNERRHIMKRFTIVAVTSLVIAITWGGEVFAQGTKELQFSGTHYWAATPKVSQLDPDRLISQTDILGVRVNDNGNGPFHAASTNIAGITYMSKGEFRYRGFETWMDKDGDKVIWALTDLGTGPAGASSGTANIIEGTGKYTGWQGTMEYTLQFPKGFPEGTRRGICREVVKITTK
jgi:hypothetical protein